MFIKLFFRTGSKPKAPHQVTPDPEGEPGIWGIIRPFFPESIKVPAESTA
jgi:hypothetical protein